MKVVAGTDELQCPLVLSTRTLARACPVLNGLPTTCIVDPQGRVVTQHVGSRGPGGSGSAGPARNRLDVRSATGDRV